MACISVLLHTLSEPFECLENVINTEMYCHETYNSLCSIHVQYIIFLTELQTTEKLRGSPIRSFLTKASPKNLQVSPSVVGMLNLCIL